MDATKPQSVAGAAVSQEADQGGSAEINHLVERAKGGDAEAFDALMRLHERRVIALGMQMGLSKDDALDACQDTFVKVFRYIHRFRSGESFSRWLYRIALNAIHDHRRRSRPSGTISLDDLEPGQASLMREGGASLSDRLENADLARKLLAGLSCLTRRERIVLVLRDLQEMTTADIGRILGLSQITVRRHCMTARLKLRDRIFPPKD